MEMGATRAGIPHERGPEPGIPWEAAIGAVGGIGDRERGVDGKRGMPIGPGLMLLTMASLTAGPGEAERDRPGPLPGGGSTGGAENMGPCIDMLNPPGRCWSSM